MRTYHRGEKNRVPDLAWVLSYQPWDLFHQMYSLNFTVDLGTLNTFDGIDRSGTDVTVDDEN